VEDTFSEIPGDEISRMVVLRIFRDFDGVGFSLKKFHQIRNPSVIDIELPKCSDEDVCATTGLDRDVPPWIFQRHVGGIVRGRDADLAPR